MWNAADLTDPARVLAGLAPRLEALSVEWRTELDALSDHDEGQRMLGELRAALGDWTRAMKAAPEGARLAAVSFYFAGTEIAPYVPQDVWADGLAEVRRDGDTLRRGARLFRERPAFELGTAGELLGELGGLGALIDTPEGDALYRTLILRTLVSLGAALRELRADAAFRELPVQRDFVFLASPGHDEPWVVVG